MKIIARVEITTRLMGIYCIGDDEVDPTAMAIAMLSEEPKKSVI